MSWRHRLAGWLVRSTYSNPQQWFIDWINGNDPDHDGMKVGPDSAQKSAVVFACVQVRSQDIAKLPLILYRRRADGGRERATDHLAYKLVRRPREHLSTVAWREMSQAHLDLRGNAYTRVVRDGRSRPIELIPLHPDWVEPMMSKDGIPFYDVRMYGQGAKERLDATDILHIRDRSDDGFIGKSCITRAREVIATEIAAAKHGKTLYTNGARPGGLLIPKGGFTLGKEARDLAAKEFEDRFSGEKRYSIGVMPNEMDYKQLGMTSVDMDWINGRKLSRAEIASLFRVPPHKVGIMDNATFSNIEHQSLEYVTDTLMPIARRWEEELNATLLREDEKDTYYFEFLFDGLLRGDFLSRMQGYAQAIQWGHLSRNEARELENRNKEEGLDSFLVPLNMWPADEPRPEKTQPAKEPAEKAQPIRLSR